MTKMNICEKKTKTHLVHIIKKAFDVKECHVFFNLLSHFLYASVGKTSLNCFKGMIPIPWMWKNSCIRLGSTWSNSTPLHINSKNETLETSKNATNSKKNRKRWKTYLFKSIMAVNNSISPWNVSSKIESSNMCQDGSSLCNMLI